MSPAAAETTCTADLRQIDITVSTPLGPVTVTVSATNTVNVHLTPGAPTWVVGVPFGASSGAETAESSRAIGVFSFVGSLAEHTKNHADGSPNGGPNETHHIKGLIQGREFDSLSGLHSELGL